MKVIHDNLPAEGEEKDGSITFEFEGYVYQIGQNDGVGWFSRQTANNYYNQRDNHEVPIGWRLEDEKEFKFLKK